MKPTQIGSYCVVKRPDDPEVAKIEMRKAALERVQLEGWSLLSDVKVIHLPELTEDDWALMSLDLGVDLGPWQPGHEVWGWKAQAVRTP